MFKLGNYVKYFETKLQVVNQQIKKNFLLLKHELSMKTIQVIKLILPLFI